MKSQDLLTITQAADESGVSRQAVYLAIKKGRLKCDDMKRPLRISRKNVDAYNATLYSREYSKHKGELRFDNSKGEYSVPQLANMLCLSSQSIYYWIRSGKLKCIKKGKSWVIHENDMHQLISGFNEEL